jgi:hypothetical protein
MNKSRALKPAFPVSWLQTGLSFRRVSLNAHNGVIPTQDNLTGRSHSDKAVARVQPEVLRNKENEVTCVGSSIQLVLWCCFNRCSCDFRFHDLVWYTAVPGRKDPGVVLDVQMSGGTCELHNSNVLPSHNIVSTRHTPSISHPAPLIKWNHRVITINTNGNVT